MQLLECTIENFGKLSKFHAEFHDGLNVFSKPNAYGKSTLVAFIRVMLYGMQGDRKSEILDNDRRRYMPWQGGTYGGTLTIAVGERHYRIERTFGDRKGHDTFRLYDADTGIVSMDYFDNIGEELFEIDSEAFKRTVYIVRSITDDADNSSIHAKLGAVSDETGDMNRYEAADTALHDRENQLSPDRKTGSIYRLRNEWNEKRAELVSMRDTLSEADTEEKKLRELTDRKQKLEAAIRAERLELQKKSDTYERLLKEQANASAAESELSRKKKRQADFSRLSTLLGLCAVLVGLVLIVMTGHITEGELLIIGGIVISAGSFIYSLSTMGITKRNNTSKEFNELDSLSIRETGDKLARYTNALNDINDAVHDCKSKLQRISDRKEQMNSLDTECKAIDARIGELEHQYELTKLTRQFLREAKDGFSSRYLGSLRRAFERYYRLMSGDGREQIPYSLDVNFDIHMNAMGTEHDAHSDSTGMRDLVGLCRRLAFVEVMYPKEKPFLLLDDPFVNLDPEKLKRALILMRGISEDYQILYLTCRNVPEMGI